MRFLISSIIFKKVNTLFFAKLHCYSQRPLLAHCPLLVCLQASCRAESHLLRAYCVDTAVPCNAKDSKGPLNPSEKRHRLLKQENKYTPTSQTVWQILFYQGTSFSNFRSISVWYKRKSHGLETQPHLVTCMGLGHSFLSLSFPSSKTENQVHNSFFFFFFFGTFKILGTKPLAFFSIGPAKMWRPAKPEPSWHETHLRPPVSSRKVNADTLCWEIQSSITGCCPLKNPGVLILKPAGPKGSALGMAGL